MSCVCYTTREIAFEGMLGAGYLAMVTMRKSWEGFEIGSGFKGDIFQQTFRHIHKDLLS